MELLVQLHNEIVLAPRFGLYTIDGQCAYHNDQQVFIQLRPIKVHLIPAEPM